MRLHKYYFYLALLVSIAATAAPTIDTNESDYTIHGTSADQLRAQMNTLGPLNKDGSRSDAFTHWYDTWHYNYSRYNGECDLTRISVSGDINIILPVWADYNGADPGLKSKWDNYMKILRAHQQHFIDNGTNAANEIYDMLNNASPMASCQDLGDSVNDQGKQILEKYQKNDTDYDATTKNGQTEGLVFP